MPTLRTDRPANTDHGQPVPPRDAFRDAASRGESHGVATRCTGRSASLWSTSQSYSQMQRPQAPTASEASAPYSGSSVPTSPSSPPAARPRSLSDWADSERAAAVAAAAQAVRRHPLVGPLHRLPHGPSRLLSARQEPSRGDQPPHLPAGTGLQHRGGSTPSAPLRSSYLGVRESSLGGAVAHPGDGIRTGTASCWRAALTGTPGSSTSQGSTWPR